MSVQETYDEDEDLKDQVEGDEDEDEEEDDDSSEGADASADDGDEDDGEADTEYTGTDRRERRRRERQERKRRREQAKLADKRRIEQLQRQLEESNSRLEQLEGSVTSQDMARLDEAINRYQYGIQQLRQQRKEAIEDGDADKIDALDEQIYNARNEFDRLRRFKQARTQTRQRQPVQQVDPQVADNATKWMRTNSWYKPHSDDPDSRIVDILDTQMVDEGWDPSDPSYWEELTDRVKQRVPHRFEAQRRKSSGRPRVMGGDRAPRSQGSRSGKADLRGIPDFAIEQWREAGLTGKDLAEAAANYRRMNNR